MALLACGYDIVFWNNSAETTCKKGASINIYLDVSGSMIYLLPKILGILKRLQSQIGKIYTWSTICVEASWENLLKGKIKSSYGTSIRCVLDNIKENSVRKAIVFTDGYFGTLYGENKVTIKTVKLLTVLLEPSDSISDKFYKANSEVVYLDNIVE
jgi:hypothetical protein